MASGHVNRANRPNTWRQRPSLQREEGNPGGSPEAMRRVVNKAFLQSMRKAWDKYGDKALEKCAKNQPAAFCKMYVLLVPREMKVEHSPGVASLTDEQLETAIAAIREMLDQREKALDVGQVIEGKAEPVALPATTSKGKA
jgi:hypothetical protein